MHQKEKEILAVLGLILSLIFWVIAMTFTFSSKQLGDSYFEAKATEINDVQNDSKNLTEAEKIQLDQAGTYASKIVKALIIDGDYPFVYDNFDDAIKQSIFKNSKDNAISLFSAHVKSFYPGAKSVKLTNKNFSENKDKVNTYFVVNTVDEYGDESNIQLYAVINVLNNNLKVMLIKAL